jgi:hypothetical protein
MHLAAQMVDSSWVDYIETTLLWVCMRNYHTRALGRIHVLCTHFGVERTAQLIDEVNLSACGVGRAHVTATRLELLAVTTVHTRVCVCVTHGDHLHARWTHAVARSLTHAAPAARSAACCPRSPHRPHVAAVDRSSCRLCVPDCGDDSCWASCCRRRCC